MVIERRLDDETPAIKPPEPEEVKGPEFDHSVPYPEAPEVDHGNPNQEHYRGARDPELAKDQRLPFPNLPWRGC